MSFSPGGACGDRHRALRRRFCAVRDLCWSSVVADSALLRAPCGLLVDADQRSISRAAYSANVALAIGKRRPRNCPSIKGASRRSLRSMGLATRSNGSRSRVGTPISIWKQTTSNFAAQPRKNSREFETTNDDSRISWRSVTSSRSCRPPMVPSGKRHRVFREIT